MYPTLPILSSPTCHQQSKNTFHKKTPTTSEMRSPADSSSFRVSVYAFVVSQRHLNIFFFTESVCGQLSFFVGWWSRHTLGVRQNPSRHQSINPFALTVSHSSGTTTYPPFLPVPPKPDPLQLATPPAPRPLPVTPMRECRPPLHRCTLSS